MIEKLNLQLFATNLTTDTTATTGNDLSAEMKTYYNKRLVDHAEANLVYDQFGDKYPIPANGGKNIEFRKFTKLPKALNALTEGTPPAGSKLNVTTIPATVSQYGDYVPVSDVLDLTAIDPILEQATKLLGSQAGETSDTITRDILMGGSNMIYAPSVASNGTETEILLRSSITGLCNLTPKVIRKAVSKLKRVNAKPIDDAFVAIVHPDVAADLQGNTEWIEAHKYANPDNIYNGELGKMAGVRFVESSEAKIVGPTNMLGIPGYNRTTLSAGVTTSTDIYPSDVITVAQAAVVNAAISAGTTYKLYVDGTERTVASVTGGAVGTCKIVLTQSISESQGDIVCGTGAGVKGDAVYMTLIVGANAYGITDVTGGGLQFIIKQLGSAGTADPLNQVATSGWKMLKTAERLVEENMIRIEHGSATGSALAVSN